MNELHYDGPDGRESVHGTILIDHFQYNAHFFIMYLTASLLYYFFMRTPVSMNI